MLDHLLAGERLGPVVERPPEQKQVVHQRVRFVPDVAVEIDDHRAEALGCDGQTLRLGDPGAVVVCLLELVVLQVLAQLPLAELFGAARLGDIRQMRVGRQRVPQRRGDENLAGRVRQVLDSPDDVRDRKIVVVDSTCQVIQTGAVSPLHDVVLLERPLELDSTPHQIVEGADALAGHP